MAAWPTVVTAIITRANAVLPSLTVSRGQPLTQTSGDLVAVALQDIDDLEWTSAGTFRQSMQSFGGKREEVGFVNCLVVARDGGADQSAATTTAAGYLASIEADIRADNTLGITGYDYVVAEMDSGEIREIQAADGASTALPFVISYKIRI